MNKVNRNYYIRRYSEETSNIKSVSTLNLGVLVSWCDFLDQGGVPNELSDENFLKLVAFYGSEDIVFEKLPLGLLWDQVKECSENIEEYIPDEDGK